MLLFGGCSGDSKGDGPAATTDPSAPTADEFPARFGQIFCSTASRCCTFSGGSQIDQCEASEEAEQQVDAARARQGGAVFDAQAAADCLNRLEAARCEIDAVSLLRSLLPSCDVWRGTVAPGGSCDSAIDCQEVAADVSVGCIGGACQTVQRLPRGSACNAASSSAICDPLLDQCDDEQRCAALPGPADACSTECSFEATCDGSVCRALLSAQSDCTEGNECESDLCVEGRCASLLAGDYCAFPE
jgi:hypothetical protein